VSVITAALFVVAVVLVVFAVVRGIVESDERRDARRRNHR